MASGQLRNSVRFEREKVLADDGFGNERKTDEWETVVTTKARIQTIKGKQLDSNGFEKSHVSHKITVRSYQATRLIDHMCRAVNVRTGEIFNIEAFTNPDEREQYRVFDVVSGKLT